MLITAECKQELCTPKCPTQDGKEISEGQKLKKTGVIGMEWKGRKNKMKINQ